MRTTLPAVLLLLLACSAPVTSQNPSRTTSPVSAATPSRAHVPSPLASPTTNQVTAINCRLPIGIDSGASGFLRIPGGSFEEANGPRASIPEIGGYYAQTYDWAYSKWLPIGGEAISPDGSRYVYQGNDRVLESVDVVSGTVTPIPASAGWNLIGVANDGVYAHTFLGRKGLWFLRFAGGNPIQLSDAGYSYLSVFGGYAYASTSATDETILRVDLRDGSAVKFADPPASIIGHDLSGVPVVRLDHSLVLMPAPYQQVVVLPDRVPVGLAVGDHNGIWLYLSDGTYLRRPDGQLVHVSDIAGTIDGTCR